MISKLQTRVASFLTGEGLLLCLRPTIFEEKRPCLGEVIINGAKPVLFLWQNQPSDFPLISRHWKWAAWGKGEGWSCRGPDWGWGRMEKSGGHILVGLGRTVWEGEQADDCHFSSQSSLMPSSLLPPSHRDSYPSSPPLFHQPQPSWVSTTCHVQHPFPRPISMSWFEVVRVYQMIQTGVWLS